MLWDRVWLMYGVLLSLFATSPTTLISEFFSIPRSSQQRKTSWAAASDILSPVLCCLFRLPTSLFSSYPHRTASTDVSLRDLPLPPTCLPRRWPSAGPAHPGWLSLLSGWWVLPRQGWEAGYESLRDHVSLSPENPPFPLLDPGCRDHLWIWTLGKDLEAERGTKAEYGECGHGGHVDGSQALALDPKLCGFGPNT